MTRFQLALAVATGAALVALAGCEPRRGRQDQAQPSRSPSPAATVTASPSASIIRPDITARPVENLPPPPLSLTVGFPEGGSRLDAAAQAALEGVLASEQLGQGWPVVLRGHSDSPGGDAANLAVSRRRAEAVAAWLAEHGVAEDRIEVIAFGEQNPAAPNARPDGTPDEAGRGKNRRVELRIAPPPTAPADEGKPAEESGEADGA